MIKRVIFSPFTHKVHNALQHVVVRVILSRYDVIAFKMASIPPAAPICIDAVSDQEIKKQIINIMYLLVGDTTKLI